MIASTADSKILLSEFVRNGSEPAFSQIVNSYMDLVYSAALRQVGGDTHMAEDVVQAVFIDLSRMASRFHKDVMVGGWLHRHTCFVASSVIRAERRRHSRERQALEMNLRQETSDLHFAEASPILDEAINRLSEADRAAILLRW